MSVFSKKKDKSISEKLMDQVKEHDGYSDELKEKKSCCSIFKLETGVATIIYLDLLMFFIVVVTANVSME